MGMYFATDIAVIISNLSLFLSLGRFFLNEPTIGLDVEDIEQLCDRIMIINKGVIFKDGSLNQLMDRLVPTKRLVVDFLEIPTYEFGRN